MNQRIADIEAMVGDTVKVVLPGESPWAEILEVDLGDKLRIKARIVNKLFHEYSEHEQARAMKRDWDSVEPLPWDSVEPLPKLHDYKQGDEVWFRFGKHGFESDAADHDGNGQ